MGKQDRKLRTLEILVKSDLALTPQVLFMNLKLSGATFERRSVGTYLNEMQADGYVEEIDINNRFTLYRATERGREWFNDQTSISGYRDSQGGGEKLSQ
jgi:Fe2+ or Zn2+ uptake regulation protein